jgi:hypothetical protein
MRIPAGRTSPKRLPCSQSSCSSGLRNVPGSRLCSSRQTMDALDSYRRADVRINGVIRDTHHSATQLLDDAVSADAIHPVFVIGADLENATGSPELREG